MCMNSSGAHAHAHVYTKNYTQNTDNRLNRQSLLHVSVFMHHSVPTSFLNFIVQIMMHLHSAVHAHRRRKKKRLNGKKERSIKLSVLVCVCVQIVLFNR